MKRLTHCSTPFLLLAFSFTIAVFMVGCASNSAEKEASVTVQELPPRARATVEKLTAGGTVDRIDREVERGKVVYDVEATVGGRHVEYLVADSSGDVLGTENQIEFDQLPAPVRAAAEKYFGTSTGLKAMKGLEYGEIFYEVAGPKGGKTVEATFDPDGKHTK
ncbi:MAG TPA: PepSY domain-containing protein [Candidatus Limnocylindrales bacterium]|nr:PepSY domain-containing protein [Candidatus Limnocylindrales bacterium]